MRVFVLFFFSYVEDTACCSSKEEIDENIRTLRGNDHMVSG